MAITGTDIKQSTFKVIEEGKTRGLIETDFKVYECEQCGIKLTTNNSSPEELHNCVKQT